MPLYRVTTQLTWTFEVEACGEEHARVAAEKEPFDWQDVEFPTIEDYQITLIDGEGKDCLGCWLEEEEDGGEERAPESDCETRHASTGGVAHARSLTTSR